MRGAVFVVVFLEVFCELNDLYDAGVFSGVLSRRKIVGQLASLGRRNFLLTIELGILVTSGAKFATTSTTSASTEGSTSTSKSVGTTSCSAVEAASVNVKSGRDTVYDAKVSVVERPVEV